MISAGMASFLAPDWNPEWPPAMYTVITAERLVLVKFAEAVTAGDIEDYAQSLIADPAFRSDFAEIVDLSEVRELRLSADDALHLADIVDPFSADAKRAFIARTQMQIHAARMHQILRSEEHIAIFPSLVAAKGWIDDSRRNQSDRRPAADAQITLP